MRLVPSQFLRALLLAAVVGVAIGLPVDSAAAADCPNAAIRAQQGSGVEALPDCMALEMVSPPKKFVQAAEGVSVSVDGSRAWFSTKGGLDGAPAMPDTFAGDPYVATRGADGWTVVPATLPGGDLIKGWSASADIVRSYSPDLSRWVGFAGTRSQFQLGEARVFQGGLGGVFGPLSPLLVPVSPADRFEDNVKLAVFQGAAADHSHVYFKPAFKVDRGGDIAYFSTTYLAGDPSPSGGEAHVYVAGPDGDGGPSAELLTRDGDGKVWGARCGAHVGGNFDIGAGTTNGRDQGAVSSDGSRVFFSTRPGQTGAGVCDTVANRLRVMRRVETGSGAWVAQVSVSECDRVTPACDPVDGDDLFDGASVDGKRVYFTTNRQLADSDVDGVGSSTCSELSAVGCDLYMYDATRPAGGRLVQVSAGEANAAHPTVGSDANVAMGTVAISGDGSHVYFVAEGVLTDAPNSEGAVAAAGQRNLFVWDSDQQSLAFVGTLASSDTGLWGGKGTFKNDAYPVPAVGTDSEGVEIGGDGRVLVFSTDASLTADDTDGGRADVYRYDSGAGDLERISVAGVGGSDSGAFDVMPRGLTDGSRVGTDFAEYKRWASEDGETIVFQTDEQLVGSDANALMDDYLWRDGQVYRLPGTSRTFASLVDAYTRTVRAPALSHDGSSVAFEALTQLLPQDGDAVADVYLARVDGGFAQPAAADDCPVLDDGCQGGGADTIATDRRTLGPPATGNALTRPRSEPMSVTIARLSAGARRSAARSGVLRVRLRVSRAGRVTVAVRARIRGRGRRVGSARSALQEGGAAVVWVRLDRTARRHLRRRGDLRVAIRVKPSAGRATSVAVVLPGVDR